MGYDAPGSGCCAEVEPFNTIENLSPQECFDACEASDPCCVATEYKRASDGNLGSVCKLFDFDNNPSTTDTSLNCYRHRSVQPPPRCPVAAPQLIATLAVATPSRPTPVNLGCAARCRKPSQTTWAKGLSWCTT